MKIPRTAIRHQFSRPASPQAQARGFSLVELLIAFTVLGLVFGLGIPSAQQLLAPSRLQAWTGTYAQALHAMRQIAVDRGRAVTLCELDGGGTCTGHWGGTLAVFFDDEREGRLADANDLIVQVNMPDDGAHMRVDWQGFGQKRFLNVRASGAYRQNGRFRFCPGAAEQDRRGREIVLNVTGRMRQGSVRCP